MKLTRNMIILSALLVVLPIMLSAKDAGSLIEVTFKSTVGVLLNEIPEKNRNWAAKNFLKKSEEFWHQRAKKQVELTLSHQIFRGSFYQDPKNALPLPPAEVWKIGFNGPARRQLVDDKFDYVLIDFTFKSIIVADAVSPGISEPALDMIGGIWDETHIVPIDPTLIFQRTRFACISEVGFPPKSVDPEQMAAFFDFTCEDEEVLSHTGCHLSELPGKSCVEALDEHIGKVKYHMRFTRLAFEEKIAAEYRVGKVTSTKGADLHILSDLFREHQITYRYIPEGDCSISEKCISAPGWRRLYMFGAGVINTGNDQLILGGVQDVNGQPNPNVQHNIFEFSPCHKHYHFLHYGDFSSTTKSANSGTGNNSKRGFCLQGTGRSFNLETSTLAQDFSTCDYQGVEAGWDDLYQIGIPCQWVDITEDSSRHHSIESEIKWELNPDDFMCEGELQKDANGDQKWIPTDFKFDNKVVDRPNCKFNENYKEGNSDAYKVTFPKHGKGYITEKCKNGEIGPLRNCGFKIESNKKKCTPGEKHTYHFEVEHSGPIAVRLCQYSRNLKTGIPCYHQDALANILAVHGKNKIEFTCPGKLDEKEIGGRYSVYVAPMIPEELVEHNEHHHEHHDD